LAAQEALELIKKLMPKFELHLLDKEDRTKALSFSIGHKNGKQFSLVMGNEEVSAKQTRIITEKTNQIAEINNVEYINKPYKSSKLKQHETSLGYQNKLKIGNQNSYIVDDVMALESLVEWYVSYEENSASEIKKYSFKSIEETTISTETWNYYESITVREIKTRRGQDDFRKNLLTAYDGRCCVTKYNVESVLEAAHIIPHSEETNYSISNGLLLRADIHTLYDLNQIGIDENGTVFVSEQLRESEYWSLHKKIVIDNIHPLMQENLTKRFQRFIG
jgi:hypothetical protein